jgi:hypothetical protein
MMHNLRLKIAIPPLRRWVLLACLLLPVGVRGQTKPKDSKPPLDLNGHVNLYSDMFFSSNRALSDPLMRRADWVQRLDAGLEFEVLGFQVPARLNLNFPFGGFGVTALPRPNLRQSLLRPGNGFSINPKRKELELHFGTFTTQVSKLTAGNLPYVMGAGVQAKVLFLKVAGSVGMTQQEIGRNSVFGIPGSHPRLMGTVRIGMGDLKKSHLYLNLVRVKDDTIWSRLPDSLMTRRVLMDGSVFSAEVGVKLSQRLYTKAEYAISAFTADQRAPPWPTGLLPLRLRDQIEAAGKLILFNSNTRFGTAMDSKTTYKTKRMEVVFRVETRGLSFQLPAYYSLVTDYQNLTGTFKRKFFDGRLSAQAGAGLNVNNRAGAKSSTQTQAIYNYSANLALFKSKLQVGAHGSNFDIAVLNLENRDVQRMLSNNLSAQASLSLGKSIQHYLTVSGSSMAFKDQINLPDTALPTSTQMLNAYHQVTFPSRFGFNIGFNGFQNSGFNGSNQRNSLSIGFQHQLWKNKLRVNGQFRYSDGQNDPSGTGKMYALVGNASLDVNKQVRFKLRCDVRQQWIKSEYVTLGFFGTEAAINF